MHRFVNYVFLCLVSLCTLAYCTPVRPLKLSRFHNDTTEGDSFDWRTKGVISNVKNQGQIGNSLADVLTEGVESLHAIQTKTNVIPLSIEEVQDCCFNERQPLYKGYDCITVIGGLCSSSGYKSGGHQCHNDTCTAVGKVSKTGYIPKQRADIMVKVIHQTPISAYINAGLMSFELYRGGVYSPTNCTAAGLDHAVQIVGYGTQVKQDYWIIKNSWGSEWGENGYMKISRGHNTCGIESMAFYPIY